jgi:hypothetical protein
MYIDSVRMYLLVIRSQYCGIIEEQQVRFVMNNLSFGIRHAHQTSSTIFKCSVKMETVN